MRVPIALLFLTLAFSCSKKEVQTQEEHHEEEPGLVELTEAQFKQAGIVFGKVEKKNLSSTITVNGVLDVPPQNLVSISAMMGGYVKSTSLLQGMKVKKGQVLATIQNPDFIKLQREYVENKQKMQYLEQEYNRQEELMKENVASKKEYQQVTADYNTLKAANSALEEQLRMLNLSPQELGKGNMTSIVQIISPINGFVTAVNVNLGKFVNPQDVVCEIVDTEHLHAELTVFEKDITKVKKGQKVRFVLVNEGDRERGASIYLINHKIEPDRTVRVHAHLDQDDPSLLPNMYLKAVIELGEASTYALPEKAVVSTAGKFYVFLKHTEEADASKETHHAFQAVEVKTGVSQNGYTEVLLPDDFDVTKGNVVVNGAYDLLAKMSNSEEEEGHAH